MQSEVSELSPTEVEVTVHIPWARVKQDLDASFKKIGQTARVRGFRQGKVPPKVVKQIFGRQVRGEVTADLVERGLLHAVTEHSLAIVAEPRVAEPTFEEGSELRFKATMEVRPKIDHVDLAGLKVVKPSTEIESAAIDAEVENLRKEQAELQEPSPMRPAQAGDELRLDYTVSIDGEERPEMGTEGRVVQLGEGTLLEQFEQGLLGKQPGDTVDIEIPFSADDDRKNLAGKTAVFKAVVRELRERVLPELDDEFAKDVGDFETLLELRLELRKKLEAQAAEQVEQELKERLITALIDTNDVAVPASMVQQEKMRMLEEFAQILKMGLHLPDLGDDLQRHIERSAERKVRATILLGALAQEHAISVTAADVEARLAQLAESSGKHIAKVRADFAGERRDALLNHLLESKLVEKLKESATYVDALPEEGADSKATAAGDTPKPDASAKSGKAKAEPKGKSKAKTKAEAAPSKSDPQPRSGGDADAAEEEPASDEV